MNATISTSFVAASCVTTGTSPPSLEKSNDTILLLLPKKEMAAIGPEKSCIFSTPSYNVNLFQKAFIEQTV
jgi:hypothetical protein